MTRRAFLPGMEPDEHVILFLRRHWLIAAGFVVRYVLLALLPIIFIVVAGRFTVLFADRNSLGFILVVLAASLFYLFLLLFAFRTWIDYYLDVWVVTDKRVVNIEQKGLFDRMVAELKLSRVQDVTSEVKGIIPTFLKFGNLYVQTAGEESRFVFQDIAHPEQVAKLVLELHERYIREHGDGESPPLTPTQSSPKPTASTANPSKGQ